VSHEEAGGLVLLAALVVLIAWVGVIRWREEATRPPSWSTSQSIGIIPPPGYVPPIMAFDKTQPPDGSPETLLATAGSPCRARGCPATRYAPLDEHLITAHHRHNNLQVGKPLSGSPGTGDRPGRYEE
jgi:hypothetical protein